MEPVHWAFIVSQAMLAVSLGIWVLAFTSHFWASGGGFSIGFFLACPVDENECYLTVKDEVLWLTLGFLCAGSVFNSIALLYTSMVVCCRRHRDNRFVIWGAFITAVLATMCVLASLVIFAVKLKSEDPDYSLSWSWYMAAGTDAFLFASTVCLAGIVCRWRGFRYDYSRLQDELVPPGGSESQLEEPQPIL